MPAAPDEADIPYGPASPDDEYIEIEEEIPGGPVSGGPDFVDIEEDPMPFGPIAKTGQETPYIPIVSGVALLILAVLIMMKR